MSKPLSYHARESRRVNERLRELQRELPLLCTDYFRSISQTTSPRTRLAYAYDLRLFFNYLCGEHYLFADTPARLMTGEHMEKVTAREISGFQEYLQQYAKEDLEGLQDERDPVFVQNHELGIMRKLSAVRSFFEYLFRNGVVQANVTILIPLPKRRERPILYMEKDEVRRMMEAVETGQGLSPRQRSYLEATRLRDTAILMLFLGTGLRVSELVGMDIDHLDFSSNAFMVTRKGGDEVILYFADAVSDALETYLAKRKEISTLPGHERALFLSLQRRRITQRAVENLVKKYALAAAPLKKRISPHKLRSTFGTNLYRQTGDIYLVADALGHSDVNTTRRHYAAMSDSRRREAAQKIELPRLQGRGPGTPPSSADKDPSLPSSD